MGAKPFDPATLVKDARVVMANTARAQKNAQKTQQAEMVVSLAFS
ncbi:hypothetical protein U8C41_23485 [Sinorhizobium meliloti]|nr:hypothetical protein [Sinorhizobium meliloti]WQP02493.1 hypothetical protein U8C41_23485 [Sinorhizobium meliloti]